MRFGSMLRSGSSNTPPPFVMRFAPREPKLTPGRGRIILATSLIATISGILYILRGQTTEKQVWKRREKGRGRERATTNDGRMNQHRYDAVDIRATRLIHSRAITPIIAIDEYDDDDDNNAFAIGGSSPYHHRNSYVVIFRPISLCI